MTETIAPEAARLPQPAGIGSKYRGLAAACASPLCRAALWVVLVALAGLSVWYATSGPWSGMDLGIYRAGGDAVLHGDRLYDASFQASHALNFTYPPFAALLFTPLSSLSPAAALALWTWVSIIAAGALIAASFIAARRSALPRLALLYVTLAGGMAATFLSPVRYCLELGQVGIFLVIACVCDVALPRTRWPRGLLVGLAAALKMTPALFIVYFAIVRDWKALRTSVATVVACWGVTALVVPHDSWAYFVQGMAFDDRRVGLARDHLNESLNGLWHRVPVSSPTLWWLASAFLLLAFGLWRAAAASRHGNRLAAAVIVGLLSDLVAPISWLHHAIWVLPALVLLFVANRPRRLVALGAAAIALEILLIPQEIFVGLHFATRGPLVEVYVVMFVAFVMLLPIRSTLAPGESPSRFRLLRGSDDIHHST